MVFTKQEHRQLVRCVYEIFDYLYKNYAEKIRSQIDIKFNFEDKNYYLTIYPFKFDKMFRIKDSNNNMYIIDNIDVCKQVIYNLFADKEQRYQSIHNLLDYNNIMFAIIKNWNLILEKCNQQIEEDNKNLELLNNFKIES